MAKTTIKTKSYEVQNGSEEDDETDGSGSNNTDEFHVMHLEPRPFRPFKTSEEYLYAMKEDLAEWLNTLYDVEITVDDFLEKLETGVLLCQHANSILRLARDFKVMHPGNLTINIPERDVVFRTDVQPGTFKARDNICNFISWCKALNIKECLLFETDDLVMRKNERSFILCLLEVARYGARYGMIAPVLVQMEQEIDAEIEESQELETNSQMPSSTNENIMTRSYQTQEQRMLQLMGLHERVVNLLNRCTCPSQFPMIKVADGKYRIGDTKVLIFVRILRNHVMVRVGGGWDTLEHYLDKHDPCRCRSGHRFSTSAKFTMSSGKSGSPNMQVTFNRPSQTETPYRGSPNQVTQYAMENISEPRNEFGGDFIHPGRKSHDFSAHSASYQFSNSRKPRSRSFDNSSQQFINENGSGHYSPLSSTKRYSSPKELHLRKENSDPSNFSEKQNHSIASLSQSPRSHSFSTQQKSPLLPSCPNKIPIQKSASKSKIPCLDQPLQKSPKSQSTEDLFRTKYYLGVDDRWMRSRSSSSSPIHGTPRSTSMEQCSLSAVSRLYPNRPKSQEASSFSRNQPGQYSFRSVKKSPELRRKSDAGNKTWSFHHRPQRQPICQEWVGANKNTPSRNGPVQSSSPKQPRLKQSNSPPLVSTKNEVQYLIKDVEQLIDQLGDRNLDSTDVSPSGSDRGSDTSRNGNSRGESNSFSGKVRSNRESPAGSRIPVLQSTVKWK